MPSRTAPRALALLLVLALGAGACGTNVPSPSPVPTTPPATASPVSLPPATAAPTPRPLAEVYAEIRTQVSGIRGLVPTEAVEPVVIDATQLAKNLEGEFDAAYTAAVLKDAEDELITLGLLPEGSSLRKLTLDFQGGQVAGYYSPDRDELFVVSRSGAVGPADESTYAHEFTHQLQDQHIDLAKLGIDIVDQSDRSLARLALVEGDATSVQTTWMTENLTSAELGEVFAASLDPVALEALRNAPAYLRETALFPYQSGLALVMRLVLQGGYAAVDAAFADPPDSTEQVLHPEKYFTREAPITVLVPPDLEKRLGSGWSEVGQDTLGELILRTWLNQGGETVLLAPVAADAWGGDRLALYRGPNGETVVVLITEWDTPQDATQFEQASTAALQALEKVSLTRSAGTRVAIAIGDSDALGRFGSSGAMDGLIAQLVGS
jgi:hypothetical protein